MPRLPNDKITFVGLDVYLDQMQFGIREALWHRFEDMNGWLNEEINKIKDGFNSEAFREDLKKKMVGYAEECSNKKVREVVDNLVGEYFTKGEGYEKVKEQVGVLLQDKEFNKELTKEIASTVVYNRYNFTRKITDAFRYDLNSDICDLIRGNIEVSVKLKDKKVEKESEVK